jgi:hypothetical protein
MITDTVQRWRNRRGIYVQPAEPIDPTAYEVAAIDGAGADRIAREFVEAHHYSATIEQIRDQLVAGLAASEYVTAEADPDETAELVISGAVGKSFALVLSAPGDALTQEDDPSPNSPAVKGRVYFHAMRPWINRGND